MANGDYGYFGKGDTGYAQYMTAFNRNFGGSSGGGGGGHNNGGGGGDGSGCGCLIAIAVVVVLVLLTVWGADSSPAGETQVLSMWIFEAACRKKRSMVE